MGKRIHRSNCDGSGSPHCGSVALLRGKHFSPLPTSRCPDFVTFPLSPSALSNMPTPILPVKTLDDSTVITSPIFKGKGDMPLSLEELTKPHKLALIKNCQRSVGLEIISMSEVRLTE